MDQLFNSGELFGRGGNNSDTELNGVLFSFPISGIPSEGSVDSFHRCLTNSLRQASADIFVKALDKDLGQRVVMSIEFEIQGISSDGTIIRKGSIRDSYLKDPALIGKLVIYSPDVE